MKTCFVPGCYEQGVAVRIGERKVHVCPAHVAGAKEAARSVLETGVRTLGKIAEHRYPNTVAFLRGMLRAD